LYLKAKGSKKRSLIGPDRERRSPPDETPERKISFGQDLVSETWELKIDAL
jgi:hypothetical protein